MKKSLKTALVGSVVAGAVLAAPMASAQSLPLIPGSSSGPVTPPPPPSTTAQNTEQVWLGDRSYRVSLPDTYSPERDYPVVLGFAG